jgi:hypothetical protein
MEARMNSDIEARCRRPNVAAFVVLATIIVGTTSGAVFLGARAVATFHHESYLLVLMPTVGESISFWMLNYQLCLYARVYDCYKRRAMMMPGMALLGAAGVAEFILTAISHIKIFAEFQNEVAFLGTAFFYVNVLIFFLLVAYFVRNRRPRRDG